MLRPLLLSALIFSLAASGLPASEALAHVGGHPHAHQRGGRHIRRRHSRAWWRRRRAWLQRRRARALERRRLSATTADVAAAITSVPLNTKSAPAAAAVVPRQRPPVGAPPRSASSLLSSSLRRQPPQQQQQLQQRVSAPYHFQLPRSWSRVSTPVAGEMKFIILDAGGRAAGTAVITPVMTAGAAPAMVGSARRKMLGAVPVSLLNRTVIDRMVKEGGWVVNDALREIDGRAVYIVFAQSGAAGVASQSWTFYFTEVDGRIYSLATIAPPELTTPLAIEAEQVVASLRLNNPGGSTTTTTTAGIHAGAALR